VKVLVVQIIDRTRPVDDTEPVVYTFLLKTENVEEIIEGVLPFIQKAIEWAFDNPEELIGALSEISEMIREYFTADEMEAIPYWEDESGEIAVRLHLFEVTKTIGG